MSIDALHTALDKLARQDLRWTQFKMSRKTLESLVKLPENLGETSLLGTPVEIDESLPTGTMRITIDYDVTGYQPYAW